MSSSSMLHPYLSKTFSTCPIFFWIFPPTFSACPSASSFGLSVTRPAISLTAPFTSCALPFSLSFVLCFIRFLSLWSTNTDMSTFITNALAAVQTIGQAIRLLPESGSTM